MRPKVSVIIPVYNVEPYLAECLDSIVGQGLQQIEIICVDDGSTDGSSAILREYAARDARIQVVTQSNGGLSAARNAGMARASGEYLYFMDSDDRLARDALGYLYGEAVKDKLDVLYFDGESFYESPELEAQFPGYKTCYKRPRELAEVYSGCELFTELHKDRAYCVSACLQMIRRDYLAEAGIAFPVGLLYEDNLFSIQCMLSAERVSHRKKVLFYRRVRKGSIITAGITFKNVYGYFCCYLGMTAYLQGKNIPAETEHFVEDELRIISNNAANFYRRLPESEQKEVDKLPVEQRFFFQQFLVPYAMGAQNALYELQEVRASLSFRIGRFVTFVPRKIRGGVRCWRENGLRYTLYRIKEKTKCFMGREQ
jgi:glycosyltransferase involved in cell wall biosynthesis